MSLIINMSLSESRLNGNINELQEIITKLFIEYENDEFMISKLYNYVSELPIILKNIKI